MASHVETTDVPLLYSYFTTLQSKTVPEVWDKLYGPRLDQKTPPP